MSKNFLPLLTLTCLIFLLTGCYRSAYYFSPLNANSNGYKTIPLQSDSVKGASYVGANLRLGLANFGWRDGLYSFTGSFHRSNNWKKFQAFYGANISAGGYYVQDYRYTISDHFIDTSYINKRAGSKFFGSAGLQGGINYVVPIDNNGSEWRVIGLEAALQKEVGDYLDFRKQLPDTAARVIGRTSLFTNLGLTTEILRKKKNYSFGIRFAIGIGLPNYRNGYTGDKTLPFYFSPAFHYTRSRVTGFGQFNITKAYAFSLQFGTQYKLKKNGSSAPLHSN
ncbi:MAG: hypothetical protein ABIQ31_27345 [Ferruginibacter sp.]